MIEVLVGGVLGAIIGSFLNVLTLRREQGKSIGGRSACMSCGTTLRTLELVPILSWIALRGRCSTCGSAISLQYPIVEIVTAIVFALLISAPIGLLFKALSLPIAALLIAIAVYDLRTKIIPDAWVAILGGLCLLTAILGTLYVHGSYFLALLAGPVAALPLFILWYVSGGRWMGLGDPKLALSLGWLLGFSGGLNAVLLAFIIGACVGVPLLFFSSRTWMRMREFIPTSAFRKPQLGFTMKSEIPFGPFLVSSSFIVWFSQMYNLFTPFVWH